MRTKFFLITIAWIVALSCGKTESQKQKEEASNKELLYLAIVTRPASTPAGCTLIDTNTATTNSNSLIKNITISETTTELCSSECTGSSCAMQLTFATPGTYSVTLNQAYQTRKCGSSTHIQELNVSYGTFTNSPFSFTSAISTGTASPISINETLTAGAVRLVRGTLQLAYPGICVGQGTYTGTDKYTIRITKIN